LERLRRSKLFEDLRLPSVRPQEEVPVEKRTGVVAAVIEIAYDLIALIDGEPTNLHFGEESGVRKSSARTPSQKTGAVGLAERTRLC
jgi:hypothetical protein